MNATFTNFVTITLFLLASKFLQIISFQPMSKQEQIKKINKMNGAVEPFRRNLTECARQVKADMVDVENFLKRIPQSSMQGKCFVACILKRNAIIRNNKIDIESLLEANRAVYGDDSEVLSRLKVATLECTDVVSDIFEVCEYASIFNDCMHMKMEHALEKAAMEGRLEALGRAADPDRWTDDDDEILKLVKDEL